MTFHYTQNSVADGCGPGPVVGSGVIGERIITVPNAPRMHISSAFRVNLTVKPELTDDVTLCVRGDDNLLRFVRATRRGDVIALALEDGAYRNLTALSVTASVGRLSEVVTVDVARATLSGMRASTIKLASSGASRIDAAGCAGEWQIVAAGSGSVRLATERAAHVVVAALHAGVVWLQGEADALSVRAHGGARVHAGARDFASKRARVELSGTAEARVHASVGIVGRVQFPSTLRVACRGRIAIDGAYRCE